ncbi:MAG TPA: DUF4037 domain-containing protein [Pyrinomonadaceae bacterium]|nr:DUF4037 domain-containing protein [Pyrinomonadaceae bacterium]
MPEPVKGLTLARLFYEEAARPILDARFPGLAHSAALVGWSSEVLGFDDQTSTDHNWGPRFVLFLPDEDHARHAEAVGRALAEDLPVEFRGRPTHYAPEPGHDWPVFKRIERGPVRHKIDIHAVGEYFNWYLGRDPREKLSAADWLTFQEHKLLAVTSGEVFHDGLGSLELARRKLAYYPEQIWLHLLVCEWLDISNEEAFVGRAGEVGDELGSAVIAARLVRHLMRLCFLMERTYAPYSKWFGTAFARLACGPEMTPLLAAVLRAQDWRERERALAPAYEYVARAHNRLGLTAPVEDKVTPHGRPYLVIHAERFAEALAAKVNDPELRAMRFPVGSVSQLLHGDHLTMSAPLCRALRTLYERQPK